jgi:hypothetical protein
MSKLYNGMLNDLCCPQYITSVITSDSIIWVVRVSRVEEERSAYGVLVGKPEEKRPLGKAWHKWEDNIRTGFQKKQEQTAWTRLISLLPI